MQHFPLFADLRNRPVLIVGGGVVAERRVRLLLDAHAAITVLSPTLSEHLTELAAAGTIRYVAGPYRDQPLEPYWLVIAATDDRAVNEAVANAATAARRLCNVVDDQELCTFIMPAIVDRAPVTIAIGSSGASPVLARWIKGLIETLLPARLGALAELARRWRERVRHRLPDSTQRRHFWERIVTGVVAEHAFAGRDADAERALEASLESFGGEDAARQGEAYLVGAGPGAIDLITIRGRQLLAAADVVLYDRLASAELLQYARRDAELISVGKTPRRPSISQKQLNRLLVTLVQSGKRVCRLKGGDPFVFGRGGEELEALVEAGLKFQVVPGVSAAEGCAAYAGIPLTLRGVSQAVLLATGHTRADGSPLIGEYEPERTLALYMGVSQYAELAAALIDRGYPRGTPVAVVESGTTERQRIVRTTLEDLGAAQVALRIEPPALLVVGETTRYAERYSWFAPSTIEHFASASANPSADVSYEQSSTKAAP